MEYSTGDVIISLAGHDKEQKFIVTGVRGKALLIADGRLRKIDTPKLKSKKHVKKIGTVKAEDAKALSERIGYFSVSAGTSDSRIRNLLRNTEYQLL